MVPQGSDQYQRMRGIVSGRWRVVGAGAGRSVAGWVRRREMNENISQILLHYVLGRNF